MPWRLIGIIIILAVLLAFIGLNLNNTCDLSLGFTTFSGVPIYLTVFASFMLGMLCSLPFMIFGALKKRPKKEPFKNPFAGKDEGPKKAGKTEGPSPGNPGPYGID